MKILLTCQRRVARYKHSTFVAEIFKNTDIIFFNILTLLRRKLETLTEKKEWAFCTSYLSFCVFHVDNNTIEEL